MKTRIRLFVISLGMSALMGACSGGTPSRAPCEQIVEACHAVDPGTGPIHDCHEFAEATSSTPEACTMRQATCLPLCAAAADAGRDAAADAAMDAMADGAGG